MQAILDIVRARLRADGITQSALAKKLNVSLPTIKRWLRGDGLDVRALERIISETGLTISEIAISAEAHTQRTFQYTEEQESVLARVSGALTVFDLLLQGLSMKQVGHKTDISHRDLARVLRELERGKLIERHPGNRVKVIPSGEPVWSKNGPLSRKFKRNAVAGFMAMTEQQNGVLLGVYRLRNDDVRRIHVMLDDLRAFLRRAELRARATPLEAKTYGLLTAYGPFDWAVLNADKNTYQHQFVGSPSVSCLKSLRKVPTV